MNIKFKINLIEFIVAQFTLVTIINLLALFAFVFTFITGRENLLGFLHLLDVREQSIPTYISLLNLLLSSILLFIIFKYEKTNSCKGSSYWLFLSFLFLFLSVDESAGIHEKFGNVGNFLANKGIIPLILETHMWLPFGVLFVLIIGIALIPYYKLLPRDTFFYFAISGLIFLTGAIGFEFIGALMLETGFVESKSDIIYKIRRLLEEAFEMYGIAMFNCALYREILNRKISLTIQNH